MADAAKGLSHAALSAAESALGGELPPGYRQFLLAHNGLKPSGGFCYDPDLAPEGFSPTEDAIEVAVFYGVGADSQARGTGDLLTQAKACHQALAREGKSLPAEWIRIGRTIDDDELFLALGGPDAGSVYLLYARDEYFAEDFAELFDAKGHLACPADLMLSRDFQRFLHSAAP